MLVSTPGDSAASQVKLNITILVYIYFNLLFSDGFSTTTATLRTRSYNTHWIRKLHAHWLPVQVSPPLRERIQHSPSVRDLLLGTELHRAVDGQIFVGTPVFNGVIDSLVLAGQSDKDFVATAANYFAYQTGLPSKSWKSIKFAKTCGRDAIVVVP